MEDSILKSTKKILGIDPDYKIFDLDILTHINAAFSVVNQLGIGTAETFFVEDEAKTWASLALPVAQRTMLRSYIWLKVRMLFDPPTTSFLIDAMNKQIAEFESRLLYFREDTESFPIVIPEEV